jgi:hypothetical protein
MVDIICIYAFVRVIWKVTETGDTRPPVLPNMGTISYVTMRKQYKGKLREWSKLVFSPKSILTRELHPQF